MTFPCLRGVARSAQLLDLGADVVRPVEASLQGSLVHLRHPFLCFWSARHRAAKPGDTPGGGGGDGSETDGRVGVDLDCVAAAAVRPKAKPLNGVVAVVVFPQATRPTKGLRTGGLRITSS